MIIRKSESEISIMRKGGRILAKLFLEMEKKIKPGVSGKQLDAFAYEFIKENNARPAFKGYKGFPSSICFSVNDVVVHGIPDEKKLNEGEIVGIDIGLIYGGYYSDSAFTYEVGKISNEAKNLIKKTNEALYAGIKKCVSGNRLGDVSSAIQNIVEEAGYSVVRELVGHGIGANMHEDPQIPNYGRSNNGPKLSNGMTLAIEPMINEGKKEVVFLKDGWTVKTVDKKLSAHFEHTIVVRDDKPEILTKL